VIWPILQHAFTVAGFLLAVVLLSRVLLDHRRPAGAMAWVLAIVLIPYVGVPLYLLFGSRKVSRVIRKKPALYASGAESARLVREQPTNIERLLVSGGMPPVRHGNVIEPHFNGESVYRALMVLIDRAEHSICVMTFILGNDAIGRAIMDRLAEKAANGIEVRVLVDDLGSFWFRSAHAKALVANGGKFARFLPVAPLRRRWSANLRNHRKIVVVDGAYAMSGGMNLAANYIGPSPLAGRFVDSAVFVEGPAAADLEAIFWRDWHFTTGEAARNPTPVEQPAANDVGLLQIVASGPDVPEDALHDAFLRAAMDARERIWIVTPYFVPDDAVLKALALQARIGVDVRLIVPARSNHLIPDVARGPALRELIRAGAGVHLYTAGMIHAKTLVFDDDIAVTGSPNLDMRSMFLNFEVALFHYSAPEVAAVAGWTERMLADSNRYEEEQVGLVRGWAEGLSLLVAPLL